jgi:ribosome-associated translation inhibitor RaiA
VDVPSIVVSFKDLPTNDGVRDNVEKRCRVLAEEFPETTHFVVTLTPDGTGHTAHARVTGRQVDVATHAKAIELAQAADRLLDKIERKLRRVHDKRIFARRREAQRANPKRGI